MAKQTIYEKCLGMNTVDDPGALSRGELQDCNNVEVAEDGRLGRVKGTRKLWNEPLVSCYPMDDHLILASAAGEILTAPPNIFKAANPADLITTIKTGLSGDPLSFAKNGKDLFWGNGSQKGLINSGTAYPWPTNDPKVSYTERVLLHPPIPNKLAYQLGRILGSTDNILWWTELYLYGLTSMQSNARVFGSEIIMIKPVDGGCYISDREAVWFMRGNEVHTATLDKFPAYDSPANEWSDAIDYVDGIEIGMAGGNYALWSSPEGACLGAPDGTVINVIKENINYPTGSGKGASLLRGYMLIHSIY